MPITATDTKATDTPTELFGYLDDEDLHLLTAKTTPTKQTTILTHNTLTNTQTTPTAEACLPS